LEVSPQSVFTTHTPVPAGHDRFAPELVEEHLGWLRDELGIGSEEFLALGRVNPQDEAETFCMTVLALKLANRTNGVSAIHGEVSRRMWQELWPHRNLNDVPIGHITNGIHTPSWMGPVPTQYFERRIGARWAEKLSDAHTWRRLREVDNGEIWETRQLSKSKLVNFVRRRVAAQETARGTPAEEAARGVERLLDENVLTLGFARRFATYKRATLLLRDRPRLERLLADPDRPVQILIAGKAHPRDEHGKHLIQEWARLQGEPPFAGRVVFIENYDIDVARHLVQGVDVWVNNPRKPEEACGTSGMKVAINGGLNLSICDGWWAEAYDGLNGFAIDPAGPHTDTEIQDQRDWEALLEVLEGEVVPLYYDRDEDGLPHAWIARMRRSIMTLAWRFSADRMVMDYTTDAYLPSAGGISARMPCGR
jgi:starch phosphorylase